MLVSSTITEQFNSKMAHVKTSVSDQYHGKYDQGSPIIQTTTL